MSNPANILALVWTSDQRVVSHPDCTTDSTDSTHTPFSGVCLVNLKIVSYLPNWHYIVITYLIRKHLLNTEICMCISTHHPSILIEIHLNAERLYKQLNIFYQERMVYKLQQLGLWSYFAYEMRKCAFCVPPRCSKDRQAITNRSCWLACTSHGHNKNRVCSERTESGNTWFYFSKERWWEKLPPPVLQQDLNQRRKD